MSGRFKGATDIITMTANHMYMAYTKWEPR